MSISDNIVFLISSSKCFIFSQRFLVLDLGKPFLIGFDVKIFIRSLLSISFLLNLFMLFIDFSINKKTLTN